MDQKIQKVVATTMSKKIIIFFDGYCILCNKTIDFLISQDKKQKFLFATLQSKTATNMLNEIGFQEKQIKNLNTIVYFKNGTFKIKSNAVLTILSDLGGIYQFTKIFYLIPLFLRNLIYDQIATNRYKWFGKRTTCRMPNPNKFARILN